MVLWGINVVIYRGVGRFNVKKYSADVTNVKCTTKLNEPLGGGQAPILRECGVRECKDV